MEHDAKVRVAFALHSSVTPHLDIVAHLKIQYVGLAG